MNFSQRNRLMNITSTALADDTFLLTKLEGTEAISSPFEYKLTLIYQGSDNFNAQTLLGKMVTVTIHASAENSRIINGYVSSIEGGELNAQKLKFYYFTVVPAFWYLRYVKNSHRFEHKSVVDVFKEVCKSAGFQAFDVMGLNESYPPLEYEIQYNESDFDFLSRILGEAGIYYYFTHTAQAHTMVLTDKFIASTNGVTIPYSNADNMDVHIHSWKQRSISHVNELSSQSYQEKTPKTNLLVQVKAKKHSEILGQSDFEHFYYPSHYTKTEAGNTLLKNQLSRFLSKKQVSIGESNSSQVLAGTVFTLDEHPNDAENQAYIILNVLHQAHDNTYLHSDESHADKLSQGYHNEFFCIPANAEQTPEISYSPVSVAGVQSAKADGNAPTKINADKGGHVKAQFFWQHDDDMALSTHGIRVLQPVAGKNWGMQFMPRQGDEMVMGYLYGDIRQPIVLGCVYNAKQLPFYPLPNAQAKTGIVTMSVSDPSIKHELTFDDTKGNEVLTFASGKDMVLSAKKDFTINIAHDLTYTVKGNVERTIGKEQIIKAKQSMTLKAGGSAITITPDKIMIQAMKVTAEAGGGSAIGSSPAQAGNSGASDHQSLSSPSLQTSSAKLSEPTNIFDTIEDEATFYVYLDARPAYSFEHADSEKLYKEIQFLGDGTPSSLNDRVLTLEEGFEAIEVLGRKLSFPSNMIKTQASDYQSAQGLPEPNDKLVQVKQLFPPVIKNWIEPEEEKSPLSDDEIDYFTKQDKNAFIFIHGYNVGFGDFAPQIVDINVTSPQFVTSGLGSALSSPAFNIKTGTAPQTIVRTSNTLEKLFPAMAKWKGASLPDNLRTDSEVDDLNGTGMHNWLLHMEDNLNRATGQFDGSDYTKYQRVIGIAWDGKVGGMLSTAAFPLAEGESDKKTLIDNVCNLLLQLHTAGIKINIMAHSLGNRVLLNALNQLGSQGYSAMIEHVFMWEAAVANNVLSTQNNAPYRYAAQTANKITILYNQNDTLTLELAYNADKAEGYEVAQAPVDDIDPVPSLSTAPAPRPALGYSGPDKQTIADLGNKLIRANMTPWTEGLDEHSYMRVPNDDIMVHGYQTYIINQRQGVTYFGVYDSHQFPNYVAETNSFSSPKIDKKGD